MPIYNIFHSQNVKNLFPAKGLKRYKTTAVANNLEIKNKAKTNEWFTVVTTFRRD